MVVVRCVTYVFLLESSYALAVNLQINLVKPQSVWHAQSLGQGACSS